MFFKVRSNVAEYMKTMEKPRLSHAFCMISRVHRLSKSMKNVTTSSPECFGTPTNAVGLTKLARLVAQVILGQRISGQNDVWGGDCLRVTKTLASRAPQRAFY